MSDDVYVGAGFACSHQPVVCRDCGRLSSRPVNEETGQIKEEYSHCLCGSANLVFWDQKCPKCGSQDMNDEVVGLWD